MMVMRVGGYYGTAFQGARGLTQGDLFSPTIFNVVVDAVVRHWVTGVIVGVEERFEPGKEGRHQAVLFCAEYDMVASSDPRWLQCVFNNLAGLLDRVGMWKNDRKRVGMVCRLLQVAGNLSEAAYGSRITGEGPTYRERLK